MYIGAHISASKGFEAMGKQALSLGANTFAFFTRNPRGGKAKEIDPADVDKTMEAIKAAGDTPYVVGSVEAGEKGVTLC